MKILVLQHIRAEHPGIFRNLLKEDGHEWFPVHLDEGQIPPSLDDYDALWVMGGPMDVWEEEKHPWLCNEKILMIDGIIISTRISSSINKFIAASTAKGAIPP